MRLTSYWFVLLATVSVTRSEKSLHEHESQLISPDGTPLNCLVPVPIPDSRHSNDDVIECKDFCRDTDSKVESDDEWRLSKDVSPVLYDLHLDVYMDTFQYNGSIEITVKAEKETKALTLHSDKLSIIGSPEIFFKLPGSERELRWGNVSSVNEDKKYLTLTFNLTRALEAGKTYCLKINYTGEIREDLYGFYRSSHKVRNETRWLAATQFKPTHARRAFPCFDEPNLRAEFDITITHDKKFSALSNMPIEKFERKENQVTVKFQRTKKMSTYFVAFLVGNLRSFKTNNPVSSVYASEDLIKDAEYSQKIRVEAVKEIEKFTNISLGLQKIEHIAIHDFATGALKNRGVTYRDFLLIKKNDTTSVTKLCVPLKITHEILHRWFWDLVSINWWSYTWMKEGFGTYFQNYITEKITGGELSLWDQFIPNAFQVALKLDGNPATSVAMTSKVSNPEEISAKFNGISYEKAAAILRMFSEILTIDKFRDGLRKYLTKTRYSSAKPSDLFEEWEKVSSEAFRKDLKFTTFAKSWTEQGGVPVVNANRNYQNGEVTFTQERHFDKKPECPCGYDRRWWIPLTWISQNNNPSVKKFEPKAWLSGDVKDESLVRKIRILRNEWLLVNLNSIGYFRVNYDTKNWHLLTKMLSMNPSQIPTQNRAQLINDAFFLASSGKLDFAVALDTLIVLFKESSASVWNSATSILMKLVDELGPTEAYPMLEEYGRRLVTGAYSSLGLKPHPQEKHGKALRRYYIAPLACLFGVTQCVQDATEILKTQKGDLVSIHPDVVSPTLCGAIRGADEKTFWNIRKLLARVKRTTDMNLIITALGKCHPDDNLIKKHLEKTLQESSVIPKTLTKQIIEQVLVTPSKFIVGFDFMKKRLHEILNSLGKYDTTSLVVTLIKQLRTESHYNEVRDWLNATAYLLNNPESVTTVLRASKANTEWNALYLSAVTRWLSTTLGRIPPSSA